MKNKEEKIKILMASAEIAPFVKVGGLGDVVGSLPPALAKLNCDVRLIIPKYGNLDTKKFKLKKILSQIPVKTAGRIESVNVWQAELPGQKIITYFLENKKYFSDSNPYSGNNSEKFLFFSLAILYVLPILEFVPEIIHCHDFHTAMLTDLIKVENFYSPLYQKTKTLYTIHNLNYQGKSPLEILKTGNLNTSLLNSLSTDARNGDINFMAQGILNADWVNTVSPTYAKEIKTSVYGAHLERVIRANQNKISGILNGIDVNFFNPAKDQFIFSRYDKNSLNKKIINKTKLQKKLGWKANSKTALVGLISRFTWQKGLDLITEKLLTQNCQFVFLGTGDKKYEDSLSQLAKKFPEKIKVITAFDSTLAQQIYAGADIMLVPSRYEPCGLTQMIAMRYGTVPLVRATGGLADTVDNQVGFKFKDFSPSALQRTLTSALKIYYKKPKQWKKIQIAGMKKDFSWNKSAKEYLKIYKQLLK